MTHQEQFLRILEKERETELIPFFRSLDDAAKREFAVYLKTLTKDYLDYKEQNSLLGGITIARKASEKQSTILTLAAFICFPRKDFEKTASLWTLTSAQLDGILPWYRPKWFDEYVNAVGALDFVPRFITYDWVMTLFTKGWITLSPDLVAKTLPQHLFGNTHDRKMLTKPENLLKHAITLQEHIWYLFERDSDVHNVDKYGKFADDSNPDESQWIRCLCRFSAEGKIDRQRLLSASLSASSRNFNKNLAGWFAELFMKLNATPAELLALQQPLFNSINAQHSKPITVALSAVKKIADENEFDTAAFLETVPLLLSSETKTVLSPTLATLEKLAKKHPRLREEICVATCQAFLHGESDIQTKASKLIQKFGTDSDGIRQAVAAYKDSMMADARNTLAAFMIQASPEAPGAATATVVNTAPHVAARVSIGEIGTVDELIFLASQAFDNNATDHIDLLPAALIKWNGHIRGAEIGKLEPALQRALKFVMEGGTSTTGHLDHLLATFFIGYCTHLIQHQGADAKPLSVLYNQFLELDRANRAKWKYYRLRIFPLRTWSAQRGNKVYESHKRMLMLALDRIQSNNTLPLLSTPTHAPAYVSPAVLIERLKQYEETASTLDAFDFQIAVSRCDLSKGEECLPLLEQSLGGEVRNILRFLLKPDAQPVRPQAWPEVWMAASVSKVNKDFAGVLRDFFVITLPKNCFIGQFPWQSFTEAHTVKTYDYRTSKFVTRIEQRKALRIDVDRKKDETRMNTLKGFFSKLLGRSASKDESATLYQFMTITKSNLLSEFDDIARLLYLIPNNPEPLLAEVISVAMAYPNYAETAHQRMVVAALEALVPLDVAYGETGHLFIGTCMLSPDKTIQSFAAELWSKGVTTKTVNGALLGEIIGKHESIEFAPLKRFTDLVASNLMNISVQHNQDLERLVAKILIKLPAEPLTNLKKLLEHYYELISVNKSAVPPDLLRHMEAWNTSPGLKKVLTSIFSMKDF
ncbi:hypothetical protein SAMN04488109_6337 [Chryseolinea serpens]|uniref:HEAT repeat-containing protein n=1 Tax=Chryseolinea serpens TaxID=947013 RepID=A0A1M5XBQ6_9BACT|nr:DUF6493 family protein [Chryseolinea serpens]SHH96998.1 hypothetical protein SAMN04488109_6337 [Chryseolinea serpens]